MTGLDFIPVWISLKTAATATLITFFSGIAVARLVTACPGRVKGLADGLLILPLVLPPTVTGFVLLLLFGKNGPLGKFLFMLGQTVIFSWSATVIAATVVAFPLMYQTARGAFEQIEANVENAARTLGASEWTIFWRITLPQAWPGIVAGTVLAFARALGEFGATMMLAGNIYGKTQTLPVAIYFAAEGGETEKALAWTLVVVGISMTFILALHYWKGQRSGRQVRIPEQEV